MFSSAVIVPLIFLAVAAFTGIQIGMDQGVLNGILSALIWGVIYVISSKGIALINKATEEMEREAREDQKKRNEHENEKAARKARWPFPSVEEAEAAVATKYADLHLSADEQRHIACLLFYGWVEGELSGSRLTLTRAEKTQTIILDCQEEG